MDDTFLTRPKGKSSMLDLSLHRFSKGDLTNTALQLSHPLDTRQLPDAGPRPEIAPPRSVCTWINDTPVHHTPVTMVPKPTSSSSYLLTERPSPGLSRDALLNRQQRYEVWAQQIGREVEAVEKAKEERALRKSLIEFKMTKAEKRQSMRVLQEAERILKEDQEKREMESSLEDFEMAMTARRQQQKIYEQRALYFAEVIARMDANCPLLQDEKYREYLYVLCDSDDMVVHERKRLEKIKRDILNDWYALQSIFTEIYNHEQNSEEDELEDVEVLTFRRGAKPLSVSVKEVSAQLQMDPESEEGD